MKQNTTKTLAPVDMVATLGSSVIESHLRLDYSAESAYIDALTAAAWNSIEDRVGEEYGVNTYITVQEVLPSEFTLPVDGSRIDSMTISYTDKSEVLTPVNPADFDWSSAGYPAQVIYTGDSIELSETKARPVIVTYTSTAKTVPTALKQACLMLIGHLYENRQGVSDAKAYTVPMSIEYLCRPYQKIQRA